MACNYSWSFRLGVGSFYRKKKAHFVFIFHEMNEKVKRVRCQIHDLNKRATYFIFNEKKSII